MPALQLLKQLIAIPSITPTDGGCLDLISAALAPVGFLAEDFNGTAVANRYWFKKGRSAHAKTIIFLGHIDVVPTGPREKWTTDPFVPTEINGALHGRGAADMKGGVAAMTIACANYVRNNPQHQGNIAMLLTSDEEGPATEGTVLALNQLVARGMQWDYGVVGEPTCTDTMGDVMKNGRRGSLTAYLTILGKQGHVAYPHKAINAVHLFAPALAAITNMNWDEGNADFPPTTLQVANLRAGTGAGNVIPGEMSVDMNWRHGTASSAENLMARATALFAEHGLNENTHYRVRWEIGAKPYLTTGSALIAAMREAIQEVIGINPRCETTGGTSDGRFLAQHCAEVLEFGTRNADHSPSQRTSLH
jgi:succinyl-diaminopimelate desuccinylase